MGGRICLNRPCCINGLAPVRGFFRHWPAWRKPCQYDFSAGSRRAGAFASGGWTWRGCRRWRRSLERQRHHALHFVVARERQDPDRRACAGGVCGRGVDNALVEWTPTSRPSATAARALHEDDRGGGGGAAGRAARGFRLHDPICLELGETTLSVVPRDGSRSPAPAPTHAGATRSSTRVEVTPETWERDSATRGRSVFLRRSRRSSRMA